MKFDIIIGNPPYNSGADLDFTDLAYGLIKETGLVSMITPAKWQTAADNYRGCTSRVDYQQFRKKIVPHISTMIFYPDALDIFQISQVDGITILLLDKQEHRLCKVTNKSLHQKHYNSTETRGILNRESLLNIGNKIVNLLGEYKSIDIESINKDKKYKVITNSQIVLGGAGSKSRKAADAVGRLSNMFNSNGQLSVIGTPRILDYIPEGAYSCVFSSNSIDECENFISWINTKFVRFLIQINISKLNNIITNDYFRFIPEPGKFDHKFTDKELYEKYKLTEKEIEIIESIIKERGK